VNAGAHTVSETSLAGYVAGAWGGACAANGTLTLVQGQNATCTITNSDQAATLTLVKTVSNTHGGTATAASFTPSVDGAPTTWSTAVGVGAGSHTASETGLTGYTAGPWGGDCAANGTVTLSPGQSATCTITNSDQAAPPQQKPAAAPLSTVGLLLFAGLGLLLTGAYFQRRARR